MRALEILAIIGVLVGLLLWVALAGFQDLLVRSRIVA